MDLAKQLVRSVVRAFYDTRHVLVIDALVIHSAVRDDDLAYLMNMQTKELHKLCSTLKEHRFLVVHTRPELREGQQRPVSRTYYFIDYRQAIDAIKWRVYKIDKEMQGVTVPEDERKEYFCERAGCMAEYTQMQVLDKPSARGFLCHNCGSLLKHDPEGKTGGHKQSTRMNTQLRFITDLLPQIDSVIVPESTFDSALRSAREVVRDHLNKVAASVAVDPATHRQAAVKGLANTGPKSIEVSVTASDGPTEAEKEAERLRKEKHAQQNALPTWISRSTITNESYETEPAKAATARTAGPATPADGAGVSDSKAEATEAKSSADLDDFFAKLRREQEAEAARNAAAALEEESEDEEDEFEDVMATPANNSAGATPSSTAPPTSSAAAVVATATATAVNTNVLPVPRQSSLKRDTSSRPNSGSASPNGTPGSDGRPVKKVKVEEPPVATAVTIGDDDGESDEDLEFEDV